MSYEVCPTVPAKITIAKDRQHRIGLRIRKGIGKTEVAFVGGAANADSEPDRIVIVGRRLRIMGIIDEEAQRPLLPGGRDIELGAHVENVETAAKSGNASGSSEGTGTRGRTHRRSSSSGTAEKTYRIGDRESAIRVALSGDGVQLLKAVIGNGQRQFGVGRWRKLGLDLPAKHPGVGVVKEVCGIFAAKLLNAPLDGRHLHGAEQPAGLVPHGEAFGNPFGTQVGIKYEFRTRWHKHGHWVLAKGHTEPRLC